MEKKGVKKRSGLSWWFLFFFLSLLFMGNNEGSWGARSGKRMMLIPVSGTIDSALPFFIKRGIVKAEQFQADIIVLDINTLGGDANAAILIRDALVECKIPTYAYISRAISAGALIALSTDQMWMVKGGTIGAAQPYLLGVGGNPTSPRRLRES